MENVRPGGTEDQYVTYPSVENWEGNVHVRRSKRIINSSQRYHLGFGAAKEWKNDAIVSILYMIQGRYLNRNVDMDNIL